MHTSGCDTKAMLDLRLQTLNIGIFRAIGHVGVYYGFKLGHQVCMHCVRYAPAFSEFGLAYLRRGCSAIDVNLPHFPAGTLG
jgi:hypothetical protein